MEVPGKRKDPDLKKGSQENAEEFCHPCGCDGEHVPAEGFCQTCGDYLCAKCFEAHTIPRPSRNHVLLDKATMPRSARKPKTTCNILCPDHPDKVIEFFCPAHSDVLCGVCAIKTHKECDKVYIPDVAEQFKTSKEFADFVDTLNRFDTDINSLSSEIKETISSLKETSAKAIQEIQQFRKEFNDYLDKKEQELVLVAKGMEQEDTKLLQDVTDELDSLKNENSSFIKQLKSVDAEICDLFITSKQLMKKAQLVLIRFSKCAEKNEDISYTFDQEHAREVLLESKIDFGEIKKTSKPKNFSYCNKNIPNKSPSNIDFTSKAVERKSDITVKTSEDRNKPDITGMVLLSPHTLLLVDNNNASVKTVDTTSNTILSRLSLSREPKDIALLPQDQAAVTLPNNSKIQIISTQDRLSAVRTVNVDGECSGISATKDNLIVSFTNPSKVDIMNFQGTVIVSVRRDSSGQALFNNPLYNTNVVENKVPVIHVSDVSKNHITKLSIEGQVLSTYTHKSWNGLFGMTATGDGQLLVCNRNNHTVYVISEGGNVIQTLLDSTQEIEWPESMCYCADQNMLYVSCYFGTVQAYKFTYSQTLVTPQALITQTHGKNRKLRSVTNFFKQFSNKQSLGKLENR